MRTYQDVLDALTNEMQLPIISASVDSVSTDCVFECDVCGAKASAVGILWLNQRSSGTMIVCVDRPSCRERVRKNQEAVAVKVKLVEDPE